MRGRQACGAKSTGKTEAVQEPERKRNEPRLSLRQTVGIFVFAQDFISYEKNAQSDDGFDWRWR